MKKSAVWRKTRHSRPPEGICLWDFHISPGQWNDLTITRIRSILTTSANSLQEVVCLLKRELFRDNKHNVTAKRPTTRSCAGSHGPTATLGQNPVCQSVIEKRRKQSAGDGVLFCCSLVPWHKRGEPSLQLQSHFPSLSSIKSLPFHLPANICRYCSAENNRLGEGTQ